jgi:diguanylate cyclase (GGDEF)-like protein/PAS domain S-box-containing protein
MTTAIFMVDLLTPLWYDVWVLYLIPLFFMYRSAKRPYVYSAIVTLLIAAGLLLSPSDSVSLMHSVVNRITGIFGGWGVSVLLLRLKHLNVSLLQSRNELEKRVVGRTEELSQANRSLQDDIAERKKIEEALRDSEARYRLLFHKTPIGIFNYDTQLILTAWNDRFIEILQTSQEKLLGLDMKTLKDQSVTPAMRKAIEGDEGYYEGFYEAASSLEKIWISMRTAPIFDQDGKVINGVGIVEDITERKKMEDELRYLSHTDELTGLYNRRGFVNVAEKLEKIVKRQKKGLFMLYADLNGLKKINDTWGHQEGDLALIDIANILGATFRESDVIARMGGDEFAVIAVGTPCEDAKIIIARLQRNIDAHNATLEKGYKLSMSWGISYHDPENPCSIDELLIHADKLMYEQKKNTRKPSAEI